MQQKGQGSLEYLLIIGGGILVAVVIIGAIVSLAGTGTGGTKRSVADQTCHTYMTDSTTDCNNTNNLSSIVQSTTTVCPNVITGVELPCCWDGLQGPGLRCYANPENVYN